MYSTNGRIKKEKETAKQKPRKLSMVCNSCGAEDQDNMKIFGEVLCCPACGSGDVDFITKD
jgi:hypothetical protein